MNLCLTDLTPAEIAESLDLKPFQGVQVFRWLHQRRVFDFDAMTDLSKDLRVRLKAECIARQLRLAHLKASDASGTKKALYELRDQQTVEAVYLTDRDRITLCLSSQVGCALNCTFCATGQSGLARNLTPGEIVEQALHLLAGEDLEGRTPNIVYMGMGEPFHNYDAVVKSIRLLMRTEGLNIGARKITVSTAGDVPGIRRFAEEAWQVRLAVSLHSTDDRLRSELVPLNRRYPLRTLMEAVRHYSKVTGRMVSFEWVLLGGVNDTAAEARRLAGLLAGLKCAVNLIPYNPVPGVPYTTPDPAVCEAFREALDARNVPATLRHERGQDIDAACGQLRRSHAAKPRPARH